MPKNEVFKVGALLSIHLSLVLYDLFGAFESKFLGLPIMKNWMQHRMGLLAGSLVFLILLFIYSLTLAPTLLHIDCGELAAVQYSLGIAHPTGYPLFSLLGYLFLKIPLFDRAIIQCNFLSALWTAAGAGLITFGLFQWLISEKPFPSAKGKSGEKLEKLPAFWISVSTGFLLGSTITVWAQATSVEVYSLHLLLLAGILVAAFCAWHRNSRASWIWVGVGLGLAFSNHMTTLMVVPGVGFLYFHRKGLNKKAIQEMLFPALAGISILIPAYGFLIWRESMGPTISWGNLHDFTTLKRHVSGHQYQNWIFAGSKVAARNLGEFLKAAPKEWGFPGLLLLIFGFKRAFSFHRVAAWAMVICLIFNIFYVTQYDIKDLEPYFLLTMVSMAYFMAFGMLVFVEKIKKPALSFFLLAVPGLAFAINWQVSNQNQTQFFEQYARKILDGVEDNALILSQQWDFLIPQYYYFKVAENQYSNILIVDKELLKRSWYLQGQLPRLQADIFQGMEEERDRFLAEVKPFEEGKSYDGQLIESAYQDLISKLLLAQAAKRPVYVTLEYISSQEIQIPPSLTLVPMGLVVKLQPGKPDYRPCALKVFQPEFPESWGEKGPNAYYSDFIKRMWNTGCQIRAEYENQFGKPNEAKRWISAILP